MEIERRRARREEYARGNSNRMRNVRADVNQVETQEEDAL